MHESTLLALREMRPTLRKKWEILLRKEPISSPLASPDSLVFLMDWTLDRLFEALRTSSHRRRTRSTKVSQGYVPPVEICPCGMNPLLAYFSTAEKSLIDAVFLANSPLPAMSPGERQACITEIQLALHRVAHAEIQTFCAVCQRRNAHVAQPSATGLSAG